MTGNEKKKKKQQFGHRESTRVKMGRDWSDSPASKGRGREGRRWETRPAFTLWRNSVPAPELRLLPPDLADNGARWLEAPAVWNFTTAAPGRWPAVHSGHTRVSGPALPSPPLPSLLTTPGCPGRPSQLYSPAGARFTAPPNWLHFLGRTPGGGLTKARAEEKPALIPAGACR